MSAEETVRDYYEALRRGEPLYPYFAEDEATVKVGVGEHLAGYDAAAEGLREQSRTTEDWTVESEALTVRERATFAWFHDRVRLAWTDTRAAERHDYHTRWTGTMDDRDGEWAVVSMHVSAPVDA